MQRRRILQLAKLAARGLRGAHGATCSLKHHVSFLLDMAELQFFATERDHEAIVSMLISEYRCVFVLDGQAPPLLELTSLDAVLKVQHEAEYAPRFFVLSPLWQLEPLSIHRILKDGVTLQYVRPRHGGPSFDYLAQRPRRKDGQSQIVASWFGDYATYYSAKQNGQIPRPATMAEAFRGVRSCINRGGKRTIVSGIQKPGPIAMAGARKAFNTGSWLRVGDGHYAPRT